MTIRVKNKLRLIRPVARCGDTAVDISHLWDVSGMLEGIQTNWSQDKRGALACIATRGKRTQIQLRLNLKNQANKSIGRMPRHQAPKKDVASCEKLRGAASRL